jgi:metal-responsive CopG/Arc/MetJ family transcriptional regulator
MGRIIKIHEIDEFSEIRTIPDAAINDTILSNIRELDEKSEMERFIRETLYDSNETPHGPTEIADILTSHVHVRGGKKLAAFVLKGKSFKKVSSRAVTACTR